MTTAASHAAPADAGGHGDGHEGHDAHHGHPNCAHHFDSLEHQFDAGKLGIWVFLVTEILFFSGLFCAYTIYRANHPEVFVYAHEYLDKFWGAVNTCVLLFSSLTMAWAVRCAQVRNRTGLITMLSLTLLCAFGFLFIKYVEYSHKWELGLLWAGKFRAESHVEGAHHGPMTWNDRLDEVKHAFGFHVSGHGDAHGSGHDSHGDSQHDAKADAHSKDDSHGKHDDHSKADAHSKDDHAKSPAPAASAAATPAPSPAPAATAPAATAAPAGTAPAGTASTAVAATSGSAPAGTAAPAAPEVKLSREDQKKLLLGRRVALDEFSKDLAAAQKKLAENPDYSVYLDERRKADATIAVEQAKVARVQEFVALVQGQSKEIAALAAAPVLDSAAVQKDFVSPVLNAPGLANLPPDALAAVTGDLKILSDFAVERSALLEKVKPLLAQKAALAADLEKGKDKLAAVEFEIKGTDAALKALLAKSVKPAFDKIAAVAAGQVEKLKIDSAKAEGDLKTLEASPRFAAIVKERGRIQAGQAEVEAGVAALRKDSEKFLREPALAKVFFSIYFGMTGLHGIHVLLGIGLIAWILVRSIRGDFVDGYYEPVDFIGLYWHLVDLIWIYLFPLLYLIH